MVIIIWHIRKGELKCRVSLSLFFLHHLPHH